MCMLRVQMDVDRLIRPARQMTVPSFLTRMLTGSGVAMRASDPVERVVMPSVGFASGRIPKSPGLPPVRASQGPPPRGRPGFDSASSRR